MFGRKSKFRRIMDTLEGSHREILHRFTQVDKALKELQVTDADLQVLLTKIDGSTNAIGTNLGVIAEAQTSEISVVQSISDEMDALIKAGPGGGISDAAGAKLQAFADSLAASADKSTAAVTAINAQVPTLQGIAAKGAPVAPPAPLPVVLPTA